VGLDEDRIDQLDRYKVTNAEVLQNVKENMSIRIQENLKHNQQ